MLLRPSQRRSEPTSWVDGYEYMNENEIDDDVKCTICIQPWQSPVSLDCQHTFCEVCIDKWLRTEATCPVCRRQCGVNSVPRRLTDTTIGSQLDGLPVRCLRCKKSEIPRSRFPKHFQRCSRNRMAVLADWIPKRWSWKNKTARTKQTSAEVTRTDRPVEVVNTHYEQLNAYHRARLLAMNSHTRVPSETTLSRSTILNSRRDRNTTSGQHVRVFIFAIVGVIVFRQLILFFLCLVALLIFLFCLFLLIKSRR